MAFEEEIKSITANVFQTMLSWDVLPLEQNLSNLDHSTELSLCGNVSITGDWQGSFFIKAPLSLSNKIAETMFAMDPGAPSESEVFDAFGEMTNMIGGNFKSILEGSCQLSIPSIIKGMQFSINTPGTEVLCKLGFEAQGQKFEIELLQGGRH